MKVPTYPALFVCALAGAALADADDALVARLASADRHRDAFVRQMHSLRRYTLHNPRWKADTTMQVRFTSDELGKKRYEIVNTNATGIQKQVLTRILEAEVQASQEKNASGLTPENYELNLLDEHQTINGVACQMAEMKPKVRSKYTLEGRACVDVKNAAVVRMEGRTAKSLSFWVGRPYIVQDFRKVGDFWYSSHNRSVADVKLLGQTQLDIEYLEYSITPKAGGVLLACGGGPCSPNLTKP